MQTIYKILLIMHNNNNIQLICLCRREFYAAADA